jgi:orotidine-5'-phosphate decarboxylase
MLNVHAAGGAKMMRAAREALQGTAARPKLVAVTVLTSLGREDLADIGYEADPEAVAVRLAALAQASGLDGVVCSAQEARAMRARFGPGFELVTPGIRPLSSAADDQTRIATPAAAILQGSSYLVIGRPITRAPDPARALADINNEVAAALTQLEQT